MSNIAQVLKEYLDEIDAEDDSEYGRVTRNEIVDVGKSPSPPPSPKSPARIDGDGAPTPEHLLSFQVVSDIHLEMFDHVGEFPPNLPIPRAIVPVLVMAGDIYTARKSDFKEVIQHVAKDFKAVVYVAGNHEYYNDPNHPSLYSMEVLKAKIRKECDELPNVYFLDNSAVEINGVTFAGGTMWTSIPRRMWPSAGRYINDSNWIQSNYYTVARSFPDTLVTRLTKFSPELVQMEHDATVSFFRDQKRKHEVSGKPLVFVTHHSPSWKHRGNWKRSDIYKEFYFANDVDDLLMRPPLSAWIHGHTHSSVAYEPADEVGTECSSRNPQQRYTEGAIYSNAYGYSTLKEMNVGYSDKMVVNVYADGTTKMSMW